MDASTLLQIFESTQTTPTKVLQDHQSPESPPEGENQQVRSLRPDLDLGHRDWRRPSSGDGVRGILDRPHRIKYLYLHQEAQNQKVRLKKEKHPLAIVDILTILRHWTRRCRRLWVKICKQHQQLTTTSRCCPDRERVAPGS